MPCTWFPKTSEEVTAVPAPPPPPPAPPLSAADRRRDRDRRERIATAVLAGLAANPARINMSINDDVRAAIVSADMLTEKLDEEGER